MAGGATDRVLGGTRQCDGPAVPITQSDEEIIVSERWAIGHTNTSCGLCGHQGLVLTESQLVRRGLARLRPGFDADRRVYELCEDCGAKHAVELVA